MESFHIITLVVASVSLIIILTIAGILLTKDKHSQKFPTSHSDVPDGWEKSETATGYRLDPTGNGINNPSNADGELFETTDDWKDIDICVKKTWADKTDVYWDGITTYNGC